MSACSPTDAGLDQVLQTAIQALIPNAPAHNTLEPYQLGTRCLAWEHWPVLVLEFARSRGLEPAVLQQAVGVTAAAPVSPQQLLGLLAELQRQLQAADVPFVLGQLSLPGHYGLPSHALSQALDLQQALRLLVDHAARLSPLLTPRLLHHGDELILLWTEACGLAPAQRSFIVDMQMSAVTALCQWLGGERLPWRYSFNRTRPRDLSQHAVYLGADLQFDCQLDAMRLPMAWARKPWPRGVPGSMAVQALAQGAEAASRQRGLLAALYDYLLPRYRQAPSLEEAAASFGVSSATLKRHLAQHGTHYQAQLDQVRTHVALYLLLLQGRSNEVVAMQLGFHDRSNFRRSFKRWTGLVPSLLA
ncbi:AraC family transcriptional regulator ligand-binding domain-containing protein [Roseateles sp.]|uniref:AraC family transcriptional regulator n=1 Tax=Roseateles sp. TaxID=1971397 RepID=UPI003BA692A5